MVDLNHRVMKATPSILFNDENNNHISTDSWGDRVQRKYLAIAFALIAWLIISGARWG
jgi:hypothetical protein